MIYIDWITRELPLRQPFSISRYTLTTQPMLLLKLSTGDGRTDSLCGYGVANAHRYYGKEIEPMIERLQRFKAQSKGYVFQTAEQLWEDFNDLLSSCTFTQCAIDVAAHDLQGRREGKALWQKWGGSPSVPASSFTLSIGNLEQTLEAIHTNPWPIYKIKMDAQADPAWLVNLRKHTDAVFRIDANASWTVDQTLYMAESLVSLGVDLIEQPLAPQDWEGMRKVKQLGCALPVFADESCLVLGDELQCSEVFDGINVKLMKCGGLTPARKMIQSAKQLGLKIMVGCMTESVVGIAAAVQLLPWVDYADVDGSLLLAEDVASGLEFKEGKPILNSLAGTGTLGHADFSNAQSNGNENSIF
jgi:L-Ala-D/L-Glu epimerase